MVALSELPELGARAASPATAVATVTAAGTVYIWKLGPGGAAPVAAGGSTCRALQPNTSELPLGRLAMRLQVSSPFKTLGHAM